MKPKRLLAALFFFLSIASSPCDAAERYYMLLFGSQPEPVAIKHTHTFASFIKATGEGNDPSKWKLELQDISWMPQSMRIRVLAITPEPGVNLSVAASIRWAESVGSKTSMWGPFEVKKELYDMAVVRAKELNEKKLSYLCNDRRLRGAGATNCIHAVSDLDTTQPPLPTGMQCGHEASETVYNHLKRFVLPEQDSNIWLCERLKLSPQNVQFRTLKAERTLPQTASSFQK